MPVLLSGAYRSAVRLNARIAPPVAAVSAAATSHGQAGGMSNAYESAQDWNRRYPPGTPVRIDLRGGGSVVATTAGYAQQWGALALIRLRDQPGVWTAGALRPVAAAGPPVSCAPAGSACAAPR
jgi:hypothetical protein